MKVQDISETLGEVDPRFVEESADVEKQPGRRWIKWTAPVAAVAVIALTLGLFVRGGKDPYQPKPSSVTDLSGEQEAGLLDPAALQQYALAAAVYPVMAKLPREEYDEATYSSWLTDRHKQLAYKGAGENLTDFFAATAAEFLAGAGSNNRVYSPVNVYMALAMLAEITDGDTRGQILDLLGSEDIAALREQVYALWNANYFDDGTVTSIPANSLWLNEKCSFNQTTLQTLADSYFASSYRGDMGSDAFTAALQTWMNEQTGGLLKGQIGGVKTYQDDVIELVSTLYFKAGWMSQFSPSGTSEDTFHSPTGDVTRDFMHANEQKGTYMKGDGFTGAALPLANSGSVLFLLPDDGMTPEELLENEGALTLIATGGKHGGQVQYENSYLNLTIPKFNATSRLDLIEGLKRLGVTDCFDKDLADFSPLLETGDAAEMRVSRAIHGARVVMDEEGVEAAAYTQIPVELVAYVERKLFTFTADRPFIFAVTGSDGLPLFVGIVNQV